MMRGVTRSLCMALGLVLLLSAACCCNAKKLWGVDVGNKEQEERGEFAALLQKASGQGAGSMSGGSPDDVVANIDSALAMLADADLSSMSMSELCTSGIDAVLQLLKDEEWIGQYAEPGAIGDVLQNPGMAAAMGGGEYAAGNDDLMELLSLENSPILYKTKYYELIEKMIGQLVSLRMDVSDPAKLRTMVEGMLDSYGMDAASKAQIMEIVENPAIVAAQIKQYVDDPAVKQQLNAVMDGFMSATNEVADVDEEEMLDMLAAMEQEDPEMMQQMMAELMKDPSFAESMTAEQEAPAAGRGGGGVFKGAGRPGQPVEL